MADGQPAGRLWRLCNLLMAAFFGLAAAVQVNDPDAGLWTVVYLVPSALTLLVSINPSITDHGVWRSLCDLHSAGCIVGTIALACSLFAYAQRNILHEEEGRCLHSVEVKRWLIPRPFRVWNTGMLLCSVLRREMCCGIELFGLVIITIWMSLCRSSAKCVLKTATSRCGHDHNSTCLRISVPESRTHRALPLTVSVFQRYQSWRGKLRRVTGHTSWQGQSQNRPSGSTATCVRSFHLRASPLSAAAG
ncbi:transmembrane protein 220 isoform X2 [Caloenas nicobarica]|uniref:transmembrane protein 220 isoform X2 n=1 Tax=Caloenas nicobarica TaxID=187106 RepID=UPI0032B82AA6